MSHFSRIKSQIKDESALVEALTNMGLTPEIHEREVSLNNKWNTSDLAHVIIRARQLGCGADVGFRRVEGGFEVSADDYELARSPYSNFRQQLSLEYMTVMARRNGYKVLGTERLPNGQYRLKLSPPQRLQQRR